LGKSIIPQRFAVFVSRAFMVIQVHVAVEYCVATSVRKPFINFVIAATTMGEHHPELWLSPIKTIVQRL